MPTWVELKTRNGTIEVNMDLVRYVLLSSEGGSKLVFDDQQVALVNDTPLRVRELRLKAEGKL
jgi:hypothetical protein